jgi:4-amino-4-deoxy-L-arabinose transferase-like glycosyltransferase
MDGATLPATNRPGFFPAAALIAFIFFLKFAVYAWMVTPLWDIPDESGHYSYANDVSKGKFPLLGKAKIDLEVERSWKNPRARPQGNWIAQHPPLFYVLDAPAIIAARAMDMDFEQQVRAARMPAALFGSLAVLGLALFLGLATGSRELGLAGAIFFGATPMFTHLSTGVSHDTLVACTAAWAAYWIARWLQSNRFRHVLYAGALAGLCSITKITGLAMAIPLFLAISWRLWRVPVAAAYPWGSPLLRNNAVLQWMARSSTLWLVMFVPTCLWIARNVIHFGNMFPNASSLHPVAAVPIGFFEFMTRFPVWQHIVLNFVALVGWNGSGNGALHWIQADGALARYFLAILGAGSLAAALAPILARLQEIPRHVIGAAMLASVICGYAWWPLQHLAEWTCVLLLVALAATISTHARPLWRGDSAGWLLAAGAACVMFFLLAYYETLRDNFGGIMRATHGRYVYPVVPFLLLVLLWPLKERWPARLMVCAAVGAMLVADAFFLRQVFAMYGQLPG